MLNPAGYSPDTTIDFDTLAPKNTGILDGIEVQTMSSPIGAELGRQVVQQNTELELPVLSLVEGGVIGGSAIDYTIEMPGSDAWNAEETDPVATSPLGDNNHN